MRRFFQGGSVAADGEVSRWADATGSGDPPLWHVTHDDDSDEEDLEEGELLQALYAKAFDLAGVPPLTEAAEWISTLREARGATAASGAPRRQGKRRAVLLDESAL